MKRELKFRAWVGSEMRYDVTGFEHGKSNEMAGIFLNGEYFRIGDAFVMQYTGVNAPDGTEVYEGDIIESHFGSQIFTSEVVFNNGSFDIFLPKPHEGLLIKLAHGRDDIKVIGHIFDNKTN